jgi:hypothetical protein
MRQRLIWNIQRANNLFESELQRHDQYNGLLVLKDIIDGRSFAKCISISFCNSRKL